MPLRRRTRPFYEYTNKIKETLSFMPLTRNISSSPRQRDSVSPSCLSMIDAVRQNQNLRVCHRRSQLDHGGGRCHAAAALRQGKATEDLLYDPGGRGSRQHLCSFCQRQGTDAFSLIRYLENRIRSAFGFRELLAKFVIRERKERINKM